MTRSRWLLMGAAAIGAYWLFRRETEGEHETITLQGGQTLTVAMQPGGTLVVSPPAAAGWSPPVQLPGGNLTPAGIMSSGQVTFQVPAGTNALATIVSTDATGATATLLVAPWTSPL